MSRLINLCVALLLMLLHAACDTAGNVDPVFERTFIKYYGTEGDQYAADLLVNADGTMLILGNSASLSGVTRAFVSKVDNKGKVIWERVVGAENQTAVDLEPVSANPDEFIVALNYNEGTNSRIQFVRMRQDGSSSQPVSLPLHGNGGTRQEAKTVTSLESGEFVVTGLADRTLIKETWPVDESNDQSDILAFRLNSAFQLIDTVVTKGGEQNGCGVRVFEMNGSNAGKLVLFSYTDRPKVENAFGYNFSFDILNSGVPVGNLIGSETDQEVLATAIRTANLNGAGFLMAGTSRSALGGAGDIYLVKYDAAFQRKALDVRLALGRNLECVAADNASLGYYVLANEQPEGSQRNITLLKVSREGELEWSTSFGNRSGDDTGAAVVSLPDGRIAILATMHLQTKKKVALIVLNSDGNF